MKYEVKYDGVTKTYVALHHTAWHLLDVAQKEREGSVLNLQACVVFLAFTFEAYLNHLGSEELDIWEWIERTPHEKKLQLLLFHLKLAPEVFLKPPCDRLKGLIQLRDMLAHGRTRRTDRTEVRDSEPDRDSMWNFHEWERLTVEQVLEFRGAVDEAIERLNKARQSPDEYVWNEGGRGVQVSLK